MHDDEREPRGRDIDCGAEIVVEVDIGAEDRPEVDRRMIAYQVASSAAPLATAQAGNPRFCSSRWIIRMK
jgi:hypothetical protein